MACVHAMALGAVWIGGLRGAGEPTTEGGHILVTLMPEPVARAHLPTSAPPPRAETMDEPPAWATES